MPSKVEYGNKNVDGFNDNGGEIDFRGLFRVLIKYRKMIFFIVALTSFLAASYAFSMKPIYNASAVYLPVKSLSLVSLKNQIMASNFLSVENELKINEVISPSNLFLTFERNLNSISIRRMIYEENFLSDTEKSKILIDQEFVAFNNSIKIDSVERNKTNSLEKIIFRNRGAEVEKVLDVARKINLVVVSETKKEIVASIFNAVKSSLTASLVALRAQQDIKDNEIKHFESEVALIEGEIKLSQENIKREHDNRIQLLQEAAKIAESIGLEAPNPDKPYENSQPLYLRGSKSLYAEEKVLRKRDLKSISSPEIRALKNKLLFIKTEKELGLRLPEKTKEIVDDGAFIKDNTSSEDISHHVSIDPQKVMQIEQFFKKYPFNNRENGDKLLKIMDIDLSQLNVVFVDQSPIALQEPFKPSRISILLLGILGGLLLGVFSALFNNFWKSL